MDSTDIARIIQRDSRGDPDRKAKNEIMLSQMRLQYEESMASLSLVHDDQSLSLNDLESMQLDEDAHIREEGWMLQQRLLSGDVDRECKAIHRMLAEVRYLIAQNAHGAKNTTQPTSFVEHELHGSFSVPSPLDADCYADVVQKEVMPHANRIVEERAKSMRRRVLRPWDIERGYSVPLCVSDKEFNTGMMEIFSRLHPDVPVLMNKLDATGNVVWGVRSGMAPMTFAYADDFRRDTYLYIRGCGCQTDIEEFAHETFHAFHSDRAYRMSAVPHCEDDMDFISAEMYALFGEAAALWHSDVFFSGEERKQALCHWIDYSVKNITEFAKNTAFMCTFHSDPTRTDPEWIEEFYAHTKSRFTPNNVSWRGLKEYYNTEWLTHTDFFTAPFYDLYYGDSIFKAIELFQGYLENPKETMKNVMRGMRVGRMGSHKDICDASNITFRKPRFRNYTKYVQDRMQFLMDLRKTLL